MGETSLQGFIEIGKGQISAQHDVVGPVGDPLAHVTLYQPHRLLELRAQAQTLCGGHEPRTAQGIGSFVALPVAIVFILPLVGLHSLTHVLLGGMVVALVVANVLLMRLSIAVFDRESILTRWK